MDFINLKSALNRLVQEYNAPSVDCIVYKKHQKIFRYFTGMSDLERNRCMTGNELYLIFSMTKILTCVSALQLFEKGKYALDDPISLYLPEYAVMRISQSDYDSASAIQIASGKNMGEASYQKATGYALNPITVRDLFTMSAGLDYNLNADCIQRALARGDSTTRDLVRAISEMVLGFEPGTRFRYSLCHDVLGALIEIWSGKALGEYMQENIFTPLGMTETFFGLPKDEKLLSRMAARYIYNDDRQPVRLPLECVYNLTAEYQSGGAGLVSSAEDYSLFLDALACNGTAKNGCKILKSETINLMRTNQLTGKQTEDFNKLRPGYGYGLGVRVHIDPAQSGSNSPIGEFGWDGAAGAFSMIDTKNEISLTYFQHAHNWVLDIQNELRNALYSDLKSNQMVFRR